ncbi:hypothetical protein VTL71DRAFT_9671 [Oculimacula yallundae]|uniref:Uncharacterized protein n=1 Tax=Oculimacula yallundae TaxID=86028 RepID=A0ABR4BSV2_9HELO
MSDQRRKSSLLGELKNKMSVMIDIARRQNEECALRWKFTEEYPSFSQGSVYDPQTGLPGGLENWSLGELDLTLLALQRGLVVEATQRKISSVGSLDHSTAKQMRLGEQGPRRREAARSFKVELGIWMKQVLGKDFDFGKDQLEVGKSTWDPLPGNKANTYRWVCKEDFDLDALLKSKMSGWTETTIKNCREAISRGWITVEPLDSRGKRTSPSGSVDMSKKVHEVEGSVDCGPGRRAGSVLEGQPFEAVYAALRVPRQKIELESITVDDQTKRSTLARGDFVDTHCRRGESEFSTFGLTPTPPPVRLHTNGLADGTISISLASLHLILTTNNSNEPANDQVAGDTMKTESRQNFSERVCIDLMKVWENHMEHSFQSYKDRIKELKDDNAGLVQELQNSKDELNKARVELKGHQNGSARRILYEIMEKLAGEKDALSLRVEQLSVPCVERCGSMCSEKRPLPTLSRPEKRGISDLEEPLEMSNPKRDRLASIEL